MEKQVQRSSGRGILKAIAFSLLVVISLSSMTFGLIQKTIAEKAKKEAMVMKSLAVEQQRLAQAQLERMEAARQQAEAALAKCMNN